MTSSVLKLRLFGAFQARVDDAPLQGLHLREGERMLAYLTLYHGVPISYRQLAQMFWPSEARQNDDFEGGDYPSTRQAVRSLRQALGEHAWRLVSTGKGVVRFDLIEADVDFIKFQQLVESDDSEDWRQATLIYEGPVLDGWTERWAQDARARSQRSFDRICAVLKTAPTAPSSPNTAKIETHRNSADIAGPEPDGGAVPLSSPYYLERGTDAVFAQAIARRDSIVLVKGARQVGKTSLLARGLQQARSAGARVISTDFQKLNETQLESLDSLYLALATMIAVELDMDVSPYRIWKPDFGPNMNMEMFLRRHILRDIAEPLVWGMDEVDRLFACPFGSEVFGLLRSWHNERSLSPSGPWSRLTLVMAYATETHLFITDLNQSPFNVGTRLMLEDFTLKDVEELNRRYAEPLKQGEAARFHTLLGGQPYLTRRGLSAMVTHNWTLDHLESEANHEQGPFGDHLHRLLVSLQRSPDMMDVVRAVLSGHPCATQDAFYRLRAAGVLTGKSHYDARLRSRLYNDYLAQRLQ